jgi:hypothetical protein
MLMGFIEVPNLPQSRVTVAVIDGRANERVVKGLLKHGIELIRTRKFPKVYNAISFHPDIIMHHLGSEKIIYAPGTNTEFLDALKAYGFRLIEGKTVLSDSYPGNIAYNAARVGNYAIHNFRYTDPLLKDMLEKTGVEFINVKQGYSKCSICIVDQNSIITSDKGIEKAAEKKGIEVLLIDSDEEILLPGLNTGFIGGSTGLMDKNLLALTGSVRKLKSADRIIDFLERKNINIVSLDDNEIIDLGSILPLLT